MDEVTPERFDALKARVYKLADDVGKVMLDHAHIGGRVDSAENSIDRLIKTTATSEQVISQSTILSLKLDHLLEKQGDMKKQITWSARVTLLLMFGATVAVAWAVLR